MDHDNAIQARLDQLMDPHARRAGRFRMWIAWIMAAVVVVSLVVWFAGRDTLPKRITIATAREDGLYHKFADELRFVIEDSGTGLKVELRPTEGSLENAGLLRAGTVDLAILQAGAVDMSGLAVLAPLFHDVVHFVVRRSCGIDSLFELEGHNVSLGPSGSGMRYSAVKILEQHWVDIDKLAKTETAFPDLQDDAEMCAAIVTSGLANPELDELLSSSEFKLLPVPYAEALAVKQPYFQPFSIPAGMYGPSVPEAAVPTVATMAVLAALENVSNALVGETLSTLYERFPPTQFPTVVRAAEAAAWSTMRLHPAARAYHHPYKGLDVLAEFADAVAGIKELLFALGAGLYLLWNRRQRMREKDRRAKFDAQKDRLNALLEQTVKIEEAQIEAVDSHELKGYLDQVTHVKLRALRELTHEDLRGDRLFSIFLMQCENLSRKIQAKWK